VEDGDIYLVHVCGEDQLVDILIKALPKARFEEVRDKIGMNFVGAQA
jgi:hypothetical protein